LELQWIADAEADGIRTKSLQKDRFFNNASNGMGAKRDYCIVDLAITTQQFPAGILGAQYQASVRFVGGIPTYRFTIKSGGLPLGLELNSFTGEITGQPEQGGVFNFELMVQGYGVDNVLRKNGTSRD
jgi:hypothetical protein